jgi:3,5-epimerase/4-reductase
MFLMYGSKGWIGGQVKDIMVNKGISFTEGIARCDHLESLIDEINTVKPTHVISTIGRTHGNGVNTIDCLEHKDMLKTNIGDNLFSPLSMAHICKDQNIHFTYLGTGCIFNRDEYTSEYAYSEGDDPDFFGSSYSVVKGYTDRMMRLMYADTTLNVRIRMPIVDDLTCDRNFITKILSYPKICSIPNSMTYLPELLPIMVDMAVKKKTGTINLTNPGMISHNDILEMYKDKVDPSKSWENMSIQDQNAILKSKRSNNWLDTAKLEGEYNVKGIQEVIEGLF